MREAAQSVTGADGKNANLIARKNAQLREMRNKDKDRLDLSELPVQKLGGRWYHRIGAFLVDEDVDEKTEILIVKFGSDAYFGLVQGRKDLREAFAASRNVIVLVGAGGKTSEQEHLRKTKSIIERMDLRRGDQVYLSKLVIYEGSAYQQRVWQRGLTPLTPFDLASQAEEFRTSLRSVVGPGVPVAPYDVDLSRSLFTS